MNKTLRKLKRIDWKKTIQIVLTVIMAISLLLTPLIGLIAVLTQ